MEKRDVREKNWLWLDNDYIDLYAKILGVYPTSVYLSLCRHADNTSQQSYPSMKLIANELGISTKTVERATVKLEEWGLITVDRTKNDDGTQANNLYTLSSRKEWKPIPTDCGTIGADRLSERLPTDSDDESRQTGVLCNYTHNTNKTHLTKLSEVGGGEDIISEEMAKSLELFENFWKEYPIKVDKKKSKEKWLRKITPEIALVIIENVKRRKSYDKNWLKGFILHPTTYLNGERWNDEISPPIIDLPNLPPGTTYTKGKFESPSIRVINTK